MKNLKRIGQFLFVAILAASLFTSCEEDDPKVLPVSAFTFSPATIVPWDVVTFTNTTTEGVTYSWNFGDGNTSTDENPTNMYTAAGTYTVTLTATNADGENVATQDIIVDAISNTYKMTFYGDTEYEITGDAYWFLSMGASQLRFDCEGDVASETPHLAKISPSLGLDPFHGTGTRTYTWSADAEADTYDAQYTHYPATGESWDNAWMMSSESGDGLEVTLVYEATDAADNIYDIKLSNTTFSGYYDATFSFNTATGVLSLNYRGKVTPLE